MGASNSAKFSITKLQMSIIESPMLTPRLTYLGLPQFMDEKFMSLTNGQIKATVSAYPDLLPTFYGKLAAIATSCSLDENAYWIRPIFSIVPSHDCLRDLAEGSMLYPRVIVLHSSKWNAANNYLSVLSARKIILALNGSDASITSTVLGSAKYIPGQEFTLQLRFFIFKDVVTLQSIIG